MLCRALYALGFLLGLTLSAEAANRFWVPLAVTGAADNGSGLCRLTVGAGLATGKVTGETVVVAGILGTGSVSICDGTFTIVAVDATHIDLTGSTFSLVYLSGGTISGGTWNATNIGNWGTASGTGSGAAVPTSADACTFDASSGSPVVGGAGYAPLCGSITVGAYTNGTLDFATNNVSPTFGSVSLTGSQTRTINCGTGTWTITAVGGTVWDNGTNTNETLSCASAAITLSATASSVRSLNGGGKSYGTLTVSNAASNSFCIRLGNNNTWANLTLTNVRCLTLGSGNTQTVSGTITYTGADNSHPILISSENATSAGAATLSVANAWAPAWAAFSNITKAGAGSIIATNCFDLGGNSTITCPGPNVVAGGGTTVIGGGL